jgi:putative salt-induced outer membrane protein
MQRPAKKWDFSARYERNLSEQWSGYLGYLLESDKFAGRRQKHNTDIGGKYIFVKTEKYDVLGEAGYRYVHQNNTDNSQDHFNAGRAYLESNYRLNATNSAKLWVEYVPNFDDSEDYNTSVEGSLTSTLSTLFSLKVAYLVKTDNQTPPGVEKSDSTFTTALVAKF